MSVGSVSGSREVAAGKGGPTAPAALDRGDSGQSGPLGAQGERSQQESPLPRLSGWEQGSRERSRVVGNAAMETRRHDDRPWL